MIHPFELPFKNNISRTYWTIANFNLIKICARGQLITIVSESFENYCIVVVVDSFPNRNPPSVE